MSKIYDLGSLAGTIMVFGGPYSNLQATYAIKAETERLGIPPTHCICTGDIVAYCADPLETVQLIRHWGIAVVMGNCEQSLGANAQNCGCGFEEGTPCDILSRQWFAYADQRLDDDSRAWMRKLPEMIRFKLANQQIAAIHGGVDDINRFIFSSTSKNEKRKQAEMAQANIILAGHCGLPFTQHLSNGLVWHNAGVVGMPANDGTSDVWYSLLTPSQEAIKITHHRLTYDYQKAALRMRKEHLAEDYAKALETGYWPNLDILPLSERAITGHRLNL